MDGEAKPMPCPICQRVLIKINGGKMWYHEDIAGCALKGFMLGTFKAAIHDWNNRRPTPGMTAEEREAVVDKMCSFNFMPFSKEQIADRMLSIVESKFILTRRER